MKHVVWWAWRPAASLEHTRCCQEPGGRGRGGQPVRSAATQCTGGGRRCLLSAAGSRQRALLARARARAAALGLAWCTLRADACTGPLALGGGTRQLSKRGAAAAADCAVSARARRRAAAGAGGAAAGACLLLRGGAGGDGVLEGLAWGFQGRDVSGCCEAVVETWRGRRASGWSGRVFQIRQQAATGMCHKPPPHPQRSWGWSWRRS